MPNEDTFILILSIKFLIILLSIPEAISRGLTDRINQHTQYFLKSVQRILQSYVTTHIELPEYSF